MADSASTIIKDSHYQIVKNGLAQADLAEKEALLAQQAGLDMSAQLQQIRDNRAKLLQFKNVYFPNQ